MNPICIDPERMSGTPCFTGTRVPVADLFDFLVRGYGLDGFLDASPSVSRDQAIAVLELARTAVVPDPRSPQARQPVDAA